MNYLDKRYFTACKELFEPYGFKRRKKSFLRVKNEMFQVFTLDSCYYGYGRRVFFGSYPLCADMEERDFMDLPGEFELNNLEPGNQWMGWEVDSASDISVTQCLDEIIRFLKTYAIPFFQDVDTCERYCDVYIQLYNHINQCRIVTAQRLSESLACDPYIPYSPVTYYAGLKCGNLTPAIESIDSIIQSTTKRIAQLSEQGRIGAQIEMEEILSEFELEREQLLSIKPAEHLPRLEQNEATARARLKEYIVDGTQFDR